MRLTPREDFLNNRRMLLQLFWLAATCAFLLSTTLRADNKVMGELELQGKSKVEKTSGVWVDGQYVGYLKELKGDKKLLLLPGEHEISVRQNGYQDFTQRVTIRPGQKLVIPVAMEKGPSGALPAAWSIVKINVSRRARPCFSMDALWDTWASSKGWAAPSRSLPGVTASRLRCRDTRPSKPRLIRCPNKKSKSRLSW